MNNSYWLINDAETFSFSAENPTGTKGGGTRGGDCSKLSPTVFIKSGETAVIADTDGPGIIENMWFTGFISHNFILRIYWDNNENPSVEVPMSAFFGYAYDENFKDIDGKYPCLNSSMMLVAPGRGLNSYWKMPFAKHCKVTVENRGETDLHLYYIISGCKRELPNNIGYFHASYRHEHPVTKGKTYTVIDGISGKGQFVGISLSVGLNGTNTCWVEGEAKMFIDNDIYPSVNYTGTEDYFGGSFAFGNDVYIKKYQAYSGHNVGLYALLGDNKDNYGGQERFMLYRWHVEDPIYFKENFRMIIDNVGWTGPRYDDYASVAYWYQTLPFAKLKPLLSDEEIVMK